MVNKAAETVSIMELLDSVRPSSSSAAQAKRWAPMLPSIEGGYIDLQQYVLQYLEGIKKDHKAHCKRVASIKPTIDDDTEDDATGEARAAKRVESAANRKAKMERLKLENQQYFARVKAVTTVTDVKLDDEEAYAARGKIAAETRARKKAEATELAKKNAELMERIKNAKSLTDDDIGDDAAGMARAGKAA